jgi:glycosyltransferase involved in cell wall biosynthesis
MDVLALRAIIDSADLLIVPSYAEGMPTVILEAMSRGLLVLASNVGAVSALVDARNGRLMQAGSVSDITQGIEYFHKLHADERQRMSDASIEKVKQDYTWADVIERMLGDMAETIERSKN